MTGAPALAPPWHLFLGRLFPAHRVAAVGDGVRPAAGRQRRHAAALFADVRGFSGTMQRRAEQGLAGVERLAAQLHALFRVVEEQIIGRGGDVQQFAGDSVLALWFADADADEALAEALTQALGRAFDAAAAIHLALASTGDATGALDLRIGLGAGVVDLVTVVFPGGGWRAFACGPAIAECCAATTLRLPTPTLVGARTWSRWGAGRLVRVASDDFVAPVEQSPVFPLQTVAAPELSASAAAVLAEAALAEVLDRLDSFDPARSIELRPLHCGFVQLMAAAALSSEDLDALAQSIAMAAQTVARWGGALARVGADDKGVVLLAVWGVPGHQHDDSAGRAVAAMRHIAARSMASGRPVRIGVASGLGVAGLSGGTLRCEYTVNGPAVNQAARLMQHSPADGTICCGAETLLEAGARDAGAVALDVPTSLGVAYRVPGAEIAPGRDGRLVTRLIGRFVVGRPDVVPALDTALGDMQAALGVSLVLSGPPGIGKSTLAASFVARARAANIEVLEGAADDVDVATPYHVWRQVLAPLLGQAPGAGAPALFAAVQALAERWGESMDELAVLEDMLSLGLPPAKQVLDPGERADALRRIVRRLVAERLESGPLLLALEDLHWADSASWAMVRSLRATLPALNLLVTTRGDDGLGLATGSRGGVVRIALVPFDAKMVATLVAGLLGVRDVDPALTAMVHDASGGHPLFAGELARSMQEEGLLRVQGGQARLARTWLGEDQRPKLPTTVRAAILQRVDRLPVIERRCLQAASVLGQQIPQALPEPLAEWAGAGVIGADLFTTLRIAQAMTLVRTSGQALAFSHALVRDVIYDTMPFGERETLHRAAGAWLASGSGDESAVAAAQAHHWLRTGDAQRAVAAAMNAGTIAARQGADREALRWFSQARARLDDPGHPPDRALRARCDRMLGHAACNIGELALARRHLAASFEGAGRSYPHGGMRLFTGVALQALRLPFARLRPLTAAPVTQSSERTVDGDAFATIRLSELAYFEWDAPAMLYAGLRGLVDARASRDRAALALWTAGIAGIASALRLPALAERCVRSGLRIAAEVDRPEVWARLWLFSSLIEAGAGRYEGALEHATLAIEHSRSCGDPRRLDDALICHVVIQHHLGRYAASLSAIEECRRRGLERGDDQTLGWAYLALGVTRVAFGELESAADALSMAGTRVSDRLSTINLRGHLALLALLRGQTEEAREQAEACLSLATGTPTSFSVFVGLGEALRVLHALACRGILRLAAFDTALTALNPYARVFPIGRVLLAVYRAHRLALESQGRAAAVAAMRRAARASAAIGLPIETRHAWNTTLAWSDERQVRTERAAALARLDPVTEATLPTWLPGRDDGGRATTRSRDLQGT